MNKFGVILFSYLFGTMFIQAFCVSILSKIPLIDHHAYGIRNFLCIIWLIFSIVVAFFAPESSN